MVPIEKVEDGGSQECAVCPLPLYFCFPRAVHHGDVGFPRGNGWTRSNRSGARRLPGLFVLGLPFARMGCHPHNPALYELNLLDALSVQLPSSRSRLATFEGALYYARAL